MTDSYDYDLFVIGAGSGGTRASRVAAAYGAKVAVAEEYRVGGTCVIRGCVPKKLLVYGAHFAEDLADARRFGWNVPECAFDWKVLTGNVFEEVDRINAAYTSTLTNNKVDIINDRAVVTSPHSVKLGDGREITAARILVATGATPSVPDVPGADLGITSNEAFHLDAVPKRMVIAGAGYIANEFAGVFHEFGAQVTLVNRSDVILRGYDEQIRDRLLQIMTMKGMQFRFHAPLRGIEKQADGSLLVSMAGHAPIETDCVMFATGRDPNTKGLGLESAGITVDDKGAVPVGEHGQTVCESIFAIGDVTNRVQLTPVAIREGQAFADTFYGGAPRTVDYDNIPAAVFSHPPIAGVGLTEGQAKNKYGAVKVYTSDFRPMKNVLAGRNERALYKMICDSTTGRILGLHMIGPDVPEILQAAAIAVKAGLTKQAFDDTVALHPTMSEELVLLR